MNGFDDFICCSLYSLLIDFIFNFWKILGCYRFLCSILGLLISIHIDTYDSFRDPILYSSVSSFLLLRVITL
jgi:hypothetical protein